MIIRASVSLLTFPAHEIIFRWNKIALNEWKKFDIPTTLLFPYFFNGENKFIILLTILKLLFHFARD